MRRWAWLTVLTSGILALVLMERTTSVLAYDLLYVGLSAAVVVATLIGVAWHRPAHRTPWLVLAAGQVLWLIADTIFYWRYDYLGIDRFPDVADLFYLAGYPVMALGLHLLIRARSQGRDVGGVLDSATVTLGLAVLAWVLLAQPILEVSRESWLAPTVSVAYILADILLIGGVVRLVVQGSGCAALRLLLVALVLLVSADALYAGLDVYAWQIEAAVNPLWPASYVVWAAAVLHPSMRQITEPAPAQQARFRVQRVVAMTLATLVTPGLLAVQQVLGLPLSVWPVVFGSAGMFVLVLARMHVAVEEIAAMSRQRAELQAKLQFRAEHDPLTDLPNRAQTMTLTDAALQRARSSRSTVGLLFLDLDGFKAVNDTLGHRAGDEVLVQVAARLTETVRTGDVATRLGGDEFVVLLETVPQESVAVAVADRVIAAISAPMTLASGQEVRVGASVGVALSDDHISADALLHQADLALYRAKGSGRGRTVVYDGSLGEELHERAGLEAELAAAVAGDQLRLHYQPIIDVRSGEVQGYEALVRWERPGHGLLPPAAFLPLAETSDLICEIDAWVLRSALRQLAGLQAGAGHRRLTMAVNLSGRCAAKPGVVLEVTRALQDTGVAAPQLVLEVTEATLARHPAVLTHLTELRRLGVSVSLDDFGTGVASVGRLTALPVDAVKIAREFLDPDSEAKLRLLELMVVAAHGAGLPVVGEGVERFDQLAVLRQVDCESAQGFLLGRPMTAASLAETPAAPVRRTAAAPAARTPA